MICYRNYKDTITRIKNKEGFLTEVSQILTTALTNHDYRLCIVSYDFDAIFKYVEEFFSLSEMNQVDRNHHTITLNNNSIIQTVSPQEMRRRVETKAALNTHALVSRKYYPEFLNTIETYKHKDIFF